MPVSYTEGPRNGAFLTYEVSPHFRETDIVAAGAIYDPGAVMAKITGVGGKVVPLNPAGNDGSEVASHILLDRTDAALTDARAVFVTRLSVVADDRLIWPDGITADQKAAALAALAVKHLAVK